MLSINENSFSIFVPQKFSSEWLIFTVRLGEIVNFLPLSMNGVQAWRNIARKLKNRLAAKREKSRPRSVSDKRRCSIESVHLVTFYSNGSNSYGSTFFGNYFLELYVVTSGAYTRVSETAKSWRWKMPSLNWSTRENYNGEHSQFNVKFDKSDDGWLIGKFFLSFFDSSLSASCFIRLIWHTVITFSCGFR